MAEFVDWFVDREKQRLGFEKLIQRSTPKQVMIVEAPSEMGKTWLIQRMRHEGRAAGVPVASIDFRDRRAWDYLLLVREMRDQLGPEQFNELTEVINASTGINVQVHTSAGAGGVDLNLATGGGNINDSSVTVGDIAGRDVIKDNFFYVQADSPDARRAIEIRITDTFFACLEGLTGPPPEGQGQVVALLFDSFEEITTEAERWLRNNLLARIRDERLPNVIVVQAGRELSPFDSGWRHVVAKTGLDPFDSSHIEEYIRERRKLFDLDVTTIIRTCGGHPGLLAKMADIAAIESDEDDDDWL